MTDLEKALAARSQILDRIIEVTASLAPNYQIEGQQVSKGDYLEQLQRSLDALTATIVKLGGPYEVRTRGF